MWVIRNTDDRLLDPSCGDGRFIREHRNSTGVDLSPHYCQQARLIAPFATIHEGEFFSWASQTSERFECVAGNPPFIRYQNFDEKTKSLALDLCAREGVKISGLTSSWVPFIIVAGRLLKPGGRMAFVVPAEIGHSSYATPLLESLVNNFERVLIVAIKEKIFPHLSEDAWLLYADGRGGKCKHFELAMWEQFKKQTAPPTRTKRISLESFHTHNGRLRKFLLPDPILQYYSHLSEIEGIVKFNTLARISIGYVTGANDFFHLRQSDAERLRIPLNLLKVAVRKGEQLPHTMVDKRVVNSD